MALIKKTEYLTFDSTVPEGMKTNVISVVNNRSGDEIGKIAWYSPWRQYCFLPKGNTVWNLQCMRDVLSIINQLMGERRGKSREIH
jgi:hypothetical protein